MVSGTEGYRVNSPLLINKKSLLKFSRRVDYYTGGKSTRKQKIRKIKETNKMYLQIRRPRILKSLISVTKKKKNENT